MEPISTQRETTAPVAEARLSTYAHYLVALVVWLVCTAPAWWSMANDWWVDPNYSHGLLVIPVALFFLWQKRAAVRAQPLALSWTGLVLFAGCALLYLVGTAAAEHFSIRVAAVAGVGFLAWGLLGRSVVRAAWFPLAFLFFAIPWPYVIYYQLTFPLQLFSTRVACGVLEALGMTVVREGNIIHLPGYALEVVEACSGVRSILSLTTLGAAYAYLTQPGYLRPWLLFLLAVPVALGANIIRLVITGVGASVWGPQMAEDFLHEVSGLVVFLSALGGLLVMGSLLAWLVRKPPPLRP